MSKLNEFNGLKGGRKRPVMDNDQSIADKERKEKIAFAKAKSKRKKK